MGCKLLLLCSPRSEVSSSSSLDSAGRSGRQLTVQVLLHSQGLQASEQDSEILSSQEDLFDTDKSGESSVPAVSFLSRRKRFVEVWRPSACWLSGAAVDSTVSEPEPRAEPTLTPAHSLRLLHLSGQGTLVQESLSQ